MGMIQQVYLINASPEQVWQALVDPIEIEKWGGGPVKMSDKVGAAFSLWDGDIWGTNTKVEPEHLLVQDWYGGKWEKPSEVSFTLEKEGNGTKVTLLHTEVPDKEIASFEEGWNEYYLGSLKEYLESN